MRLNKAYKGKGKNKKTIMKNKQYRLTLLLPEEIR